MTTSILFEENQQLKIATVIEHKESQYHIEDEKGKRSKIKANQIWLESSVALQNSWLQPNTTIDGQKIIENLSTDIDFVYEAVLSEYAQEPFHFQNLARLYFDENIDIATQFMVLEVLKNHPIYFYKQGKGFFRAANPKQLEQAKAGIAKRQAQIQQHQNYIDDLVSVLSTPRAQETVAINIITELDNIPLTSLLQETATSEQDLTILNAWHQSLKKVGMSAIDGLIHIKRITHPYQKHVQPFLETYFPEKTNQRDFTHLTAELNETFLGEWQQKITSMVDELPLAKAVAYSIDDSSTTEIDDAFSVRLLDDTQYDESLLSSYITARTQYLQGIQSDVVNIDVGDNNDNLDQIKLTKIIPTEVTNIEHLKTQTIYEIGIHIAAPSLGLTPNDLWDNMAKKRLSTVYMPGEKITMFPPELVPLFSLDEGKIMPTISLYLYWNGEFAWLKETVIEKIKLEKNLRFNDPVLASYTPELLESIQSIKSTEIESTESDKLVWNGLAPLWQLAKWCQNERDVRRGSLEMAQAPETIYYLAPKPEKNDFLISHAWHKDHETYDIQVWQRSRGNVLDKIVAELMIFANSLWANLLNQHNNRAKFLKKPIYYGIFRGQHMGKVKMSTFANPHDAMGVEQYMWATSPLRRYVDLVNQWQLIALLKNQKEALTKEEVMVIIAQFESQYLAYKHIQNRMEDYWSLAYLLQNNAENTIIEAMVLKNGVVQLNNLNLRTTVLNMPAQNPNTLNEWQRGDEILVTLKHIDLMNARCELSYHSMSEKV